MHVADRAIKCIPEIASKLGAPLATQLTAVTILGTLSKNDTKIGGKPKQIAASAIYMAGLMTDNYHTMTDVANAASCVRQSVSQHYKNLSKNLTAIYAITSE